MANSGNDSDKTKPWSAPNFTMATIKRLKARNQSLTLQKYLNIKKLPTALFTANNKSLKKLVQKNVPFAKNTDFQTELEEIAKATTLALTKLLHKHWTLEASKLRSNMETDLTALTSDEIITKNTLERDFKKYLSTRLKKSELNGTPITKLTTGGEAGVASTRQGLSDSKPDLDCASREAVPTKEAILDNTCSANSGKEKTTCNNLPVDVIATTESNSLDSKNDCVTAPSMAPGAQNTNTMSITTSMASYSHSNIQDENKTGMSKTTTVVPDTLESPNLTVTAKTLNNANKVTVGRDQAMSASTHSRPGPKFVAPRPKTGMCSNVSLNKEQSKSRYGHTNIKCGKRPLECESDSINCTNKRMKLDSTSEKQYPNKQDTFSLWPNSQHTVSDAELLSIDQFEPLHNGPSTSKGQSANKTPKPHNRLRVRKDIFIKPLNPDTENLGITSKLFDPKMFNELCKAVSDFEKNKKDKVE